MNKKFKKILAVALTLTILLVSVVTLSGCNIFRKNSINDFANELFPSLFSNDAMSANFFFESRFHCVSLWSSNLTPYFIYQFVSWCKIHLCHNHLFLK